MKNYIKILIAIAAVGFVSCEADFENAVTDEGFYSSGTANFSNYVALGNSLTSGYADGALYITGQNNSYPNIMAGQFALVGGGEFTQPLMSDNIGGLLLGGVQITSNRFVLGVDANGNPGPVRLEGTPTTDVLTSAPGPYNNMGVVGAKSFHLSAPGYGNAAGILSGAANPYYARIATSASSTVLEDALSLDATFFSLWIGNNDVLSYATSGGSGVDQTGNLDLSTYGSNDITDPNVFGAVYSAQVAALVAGGAKGVLINIPDVSSIPYFTTVPGPAIPLDAATASAVNAQFAAYNTQILPGLAGLGIITPEEADSRIVSFSAGQNYPIITDNDLTDMSGILQGRTSILLRRLKQKESLLADVNDKGEVTVEGEFVGKLQGFRFQMDKAGSPDEAKTLRQASVAALVPHFHLLADRFYNAPDPEIDFTEQGGLIWGDTAVGKLVSGADPLKPTVVAFVDNEAGEEVAKKVARRLQHFIDRKIAAGFEPLLKLAGDETLTGAAKGFAFRMAENFGILPRGDVADEVKALDQDARGELRKHGIRFGQFTIFIPLLLKPASTRLRLVLWSLSKNLGEFPESPPPGLVTLPAAKDAVAGYYAMSGYRAAGERAIRIDMLERLADMLRDKDSRGGFEANADMLSITGMTLDQFADLMAGLGYQAEKGERAKVKSPKPEVEGDAIETVEEAPEIEVFYTFTWGARPVRADARSKRDKGKPKGKPRGKPKGGDERQKFSAKPKVEKKIDPDNPFAAALAGFNKG